MQIGRKQLSHGLPAHGSLNPEAEVYFITICCTPRGENQLAQNHTWHALVETIELRESLGELKSRLVLAMPDHLHALWEFPGSKSMQQVVTAIKSWMGSRAGVQWQRDFFDHRLRNWESAAEKANYIRQNPVRAHWVTNPSDWPYIR